MKQLMFGGEEVVIGRGGIEYLGKLQAKKAFIVTGSRAMQSSGVIGHIETLLNKAGCESMVFSGITKNPDTDAVLKGVAIMREFQPDVLIAVGGGSPLDAAKVMGLFYEYPAITFENFFSQVLPERRKNLRFIAIPSTSGTGSEVTKAAVVTFREQNLKIGLKTPAFVPDIAILDADLTMTMPDHVVAETGMDAVTHAVECYINHGLDDFTECLAKGAIEGLLEYLPVSYAGKTIASREKVHHYQCLAGYAFGNVGLGMAHGISHAIGGKFNLGHGLINAIVLPYVLQFNASNEAVAGKLAHLARRLGKNDFIDAIRRLNQALHVPLSLAEAGIEKQDYFKDFDGLVDNSLKGSTQANPVTVSKEAMAEFLTAVYEGKTLA